MRLSNVRVLGVSLAGGVALGGLGGLVFALVSGRMVAYGIGTGLFVVGLVALGVGLLGATEPPEGWSAGPRRSPLEGRRSLVARLAGEHPSVDHVSSASIGVWGVVVGGGLIGLSMLVFAVV